MTATPASTAAASDYASLNHALGEDDKTLALFTSLPKDDKRRQRLGVNIFDTLVAQHRYEDALSANPFNRMSRIVGSFSQLPDTTNEIAKAQRDAFLSRMVGQDVEVLIGSGHLDQAAKLAQQLSGAVGVDTAKGPLQAAAERAGKPTFWSEHPMTPVPPPAPEAPLPAPAAAPQVQGQKGAT